MSRRKNRSRDHVQSTSGAPALADTVGSPSASAESRDTPQSPERRTRPVPARLVAALIVAAVWILLLITLAAWTANPVTINAKQIDTADEIVTARIPEGSSGTLIVEKEWKRGRDLKEVGVENLSDVRAVRGQRYLVPLSRTQRGTYRVTPTPLPGSPPLVYPATPDAERQLRTLLAP